MRITVIPMSSREGPPVLKGKNLIKLRDNKTSPQTAIVHFRALLRDVFKPAPLLMGTGGTGTVPKCGG